MILATLARGFVATAVRRGLFRGSRSWSVLLVVLVGQRVLRWIGGGRWRTSSVSKHLKVGDRLEIAVLPPSEVAGWRWNSVIQHQLWG